MRKMIFVSTLLVAIFTVGASASKKIVVNLSTQTATAYENGHEVFSGRISSGTAKRPTPTGNFRVLEKDKRHVSTSWPKPNGGAKMHYMLRLTNYGIAMHLGYVPNYPASHGCIRMENGFAQNMYNWARVGTRVKVVGYGPRRVHRSPRIASKKASTRGVRHTKAANMPIIGQQNNSTEHISYRSLDVLNGRTPAKTHKRTLADAMRSPKKVAYRNPLTTLQ